MVCLLWIACRTVHSQHALLGLHGCWDDDGGSSLQALRVDDWETLWGERLGYRWCELHTLRVLSEPGPKFGESKLLTKPDSIFFPAHVLSICPSSKHFETWILHPQFGKLGVFPIENDENSMPNSHKIPTSHHTTRQVFGFSLGTGWIASRECVRKAYNEICGFDKARFPGMGRDG